tara:strand:- start:686 stop:979 length:294 start_codon:yes stop_codon:yes gene_type:complete
MFIEDNIFFCLDCLSVEVSEEDVSNFEKAIYDCTFPNLVILNFDEAKIKLDKINKEFRIIKRNKTSNQYESDMLLVATIKVAIKLGFKIYLEPKFSN